MDGDLGSAGVGTGSGEPRASPHRARTPPTWSAPDLIPLLFSQGMYPASKHIRFRIRALGLAVSCECVHLVGGHRAMQLGHGCDKRVQERKSRGATLLTSRTTTKTLSSRTAGSPTSPLRASSQSTTAGALCWLHCFPLQRRQAALCSSCIQLVLRFHTGTSTICSCFRDIAPSCDDASHRSSPWL